MVSHIWLPLNYMSSLYVKTRAKIVLSPVASPALPQMFLLYLPLHQHLEPLTIKVSTVGEVTAYREDHSNSG